MAERENNFIQHVQYHSHVVPLGMLDLQVGPGDIYAALDTDAIRVSA